jgi:electron transfer flavoprotein alpha subunit
VSVLTLVEHDRGVLNALSLQALTFGHRLATELDTPLQAVAISAAAESLSGEVAAHGASTIHLADHEGLDDYAPEAWAGSVVELMGQVRPQVVLAAGSERGHEVMAHVAARADLPLAANCIEVRPGDPFEVTRLRWAGSLLEDATVMGTPALLTVASLTVAAEQVPEPAAPEIRVFTPALADSAFRVRVVGRVEPDRSKISLADARVVVGGGRGVGSAESFQLLQEVADLLGGTVGCSRAVTSLGWRPHSDQVGQTGTRIAPDVYIACGISGAIQHMVGCKSARCIVAINKDPEAPIMAQADYAVIGDVQQVVPALRDAIKRAQGGT